MIYTFDFDNDRQEILFDDYVLKYHYVDLIKRIAIWTNYENYYKSQLEVKPEYDSNSFDKFKYFLEINEKKVKNELKIFLTKKSNEDSLPFKEFKEIEQFEFVVVPLLRYKVNAVNFNKDVDNLFQYIELDTNNTINDYIVFINDKAIYRGRYFPNKITLDTFPIHRKDTTKYKSRMIDIKNYHISKFFQISGTECTGAFFNLNTYFINEKDSLYTYPRYGSKPEDFQQFYRDEFNSQAIKTSAEVQNSFRWPDGQLDYINYLYGYKK
jgi:hypothetical protein